ncbi:hypothetical protein SUGI_1409370 [Cryptomeria japonica]|uniref:Uncharacterized protein n=1 Tax=Cryptomeria japonica TaxID=3369 RepID=A0AAD3NSM0_CRYJA|nr:hypothetical protein SUGI_1409160 [Cryptomeria japonica]GLJ58048.1 hypothetical protein SUGI_1409230 [Cryptomeria japonica]GLJ58051.1 hypothetical protein SUGI_1409300 [Cryptomeria japonica]GLJ58054.1 hypothetical protein SUGI_1409370 [Cryptomeria japonica]
MVVIDSALDRMHAQRHYTLSQRHNIQRLGHDGEVSCLNQVSLATPGVKEHVKNNSKAMMALAVLVRLLDNISPDLATAVMAETFLTTIINRYVELDKASFSHWLLQLSGFKESLLADNLFVVMIALKCGVPFQVDCALEALLEEYLTLHDGELGEIGIACQMFDRMMPFFNVFLSPKVSNADRCLILDVEALYDTCFRVVLLEWEVPLMAQREDH